MEIIETVKNSTKFKLDEDAEAVVAVTGADSWAVDRGVLVVLTSPSETTGFTVDVEDVETGDVTRSKFKHTIKKGKPYTFESATVADMVDPGGVVPDLEELN